MGIPARYALLWLCAVNACSSDHPHTQVPVVVTTVGAAGDGGAGGDGNGTPGDAGAPGMPVLMGSPCNGWPALCAKQYDQVAIPVSHAAMANDAEVWSFPAQDQALRQQLNDSMRGLWLEVRPYAGQAALCFGDCAAGHAPLVPALGDVQGFLTDNPREVVTLLVDNYVPASDIAAALKAAKLTPFLYTEDSPDPWPTLADMIDHDMRLVVFLRDANGAPNGYRAFDALIQQTSATAETAHELSCDLTQGATGAPFVLFNQFVVQATDGGDMEAGVPAAQARPNPELAATVALDPELTQRLTRCVKFLGHKPNFVAVDFYDKSDVVSATQRLNGLIPPLTE